MQRNSILPNVILKLIDRYQLNTFDIFLAKKYADSSKKTSKKKDTVLVQTVEDYYYYCIFAETCHALNTKQNINVQQVIFRSLRPDSSLSLIKFIKSRLVFNRLTDNRWAKLYSSFCEKIAFRSDGFLTLIDIKHFFTAFKIWRGFNNKEELVRLHINGILVGDLINDSYLRYKPAPTVEIRNNYLLIVIWQCLRILSQSESYFKKQRPKLFLSSYSTYIQHGVPVRVALSHNIPVYTFGNYQDFTKRLSKEDTVHTASHRNYKVEFKALDNREEKCNLAEKQLNHRTSGGIDTATAYMKQSAYTNTGEQVPNVKGAMVIFLHDFFDSPHVYNWMIFQDFFDWLVFTIKVAQRNNLKLFIKPHPNQIKNSESVVKDIKNLFPTVSFLSTSITNKQLVDAGIGCGVTVYGTVAHELAFLGIQVISCGDNPHIAFKLCHHAKTKEEYEKLLKNYAHLSIDKSIMRKETLEFYAIRNLNMSHEKTKLLSTMAELRNFMKSLNTTIDFSKCDNLLNAIVSSNEFNHEIEELALALKN